MNVKSDCYVIAEAGLNHNGSLSLAKELIDVAARAGADAVKFQKRTVSILATAETLDAVDERFPSFGKTYREIREFLEFDASDYRVLKEYTKQKGMDFLATAFDIEAADFLEAIGVDYIKVASHSLTNCDLLSHLAKKKIPTILSTGMADLDEIDTAVSIFREVQCPLSIMHCVSAYPTPMDECNLKMIKTLKNRYDLPTGYSGHEIGFFPSIMAVGMGAKLIERHFTIDKDFEGFDHKISLLPNELKLMIEQIRLVPQVVGSGKKEVSETEWITRKKYHVSMVSSRKIGRGTILSESDVTYRNPGTGIPKKSAHLIIGKKSILDIPADVLLEVDMFE
jgi:sialic acid synthase SpsE